MFAFQHGRKFNFDLAASVRKKPVGAFTPNYNLLEPLEDFLRSEMPTDGHARASGRLYLSLTNPKTVKNEVMSEYQSNEELLKVYTKTDSRVLDKARTFERLHKIGGHTVLARTEHLFLSCLYIEIAYSSICPILNSLTGRYFEFLIFIRFSNDTLEVQQNTGAAISACPYG